MQLKADERDQLINQIFILRFTLWADGCGLPGV